jgi:signal peptidase II
MRALSLPSQAALKGALPYFGLAILVILLDQAVKGWIADLILNPPRRIELTEFFALTPVWNRGVSFGLFATDAAMGALILSGVALCVSAGLAIWLLRMTRTLPRVGLGLVIGGAIGNVIDRLTIGAVFDFLDFHVAGWHWPAFNVADAAICIGVGLLLLDSLSSDDASHKNK